MAEKVTSWMDYGSKVQIDNDIELWLTHRCVTTYNDVSDKFMITLSARLEGQVFLVREKNSYMALSNLPGPKAKITKLLNMQVASYIHNNPAEFADILMKADNPGNPSDSEWPMSEDEEQEMEWDDDDGEWDDIPYNDADWDSDEDFDLAEDDIPGGPDWEEEEPYENPFDKAEHDEEEYWNSDDD